MIIKLITTVLMVLINYSSILKRTWAAVRDSNMTWESGCIFGLVAMNSKSHSEALQPCAIEELYNELIIIS